MSSDAPGTEPKDPSDAPSDEELRQRIAEAVQRRGWRVACAESVTAGLVADQFAMAPDASDWFLGGVVAYATQIKQKVLGVEPGPVVNARTAEQMAHGVARLMDAQVTVSTTGVGGPDPEEDQPAGTVYVGLLVDGVVSSSRIHVPGDPEDVCNGAAQQALRLLADRLTDR
jgi:nicotinamide-nucleotide amidase